jgi:hypothetical protein
MLTHADVRHLILTHKWTPGGYAFDVDYVQKKINEVALQKGLMKPKQQHENTTEVDRLIPAVVWELLLREVFAPGRVGHPSESLPRLMITPYGEECMKVGELTPNDPEGYLKRITTESPTVDAVTILYLGEALQTFKFGNFLATAVMLGVAAESILQKIVEAVTNALDTPTKKGSFEAALSRRKTAKNQHQQVIACLKSSATPLPIEFDEVLFLHIEGIFHIIRRTRNDAGHPSGTKLERSEANGLLAMFPPYCKTAHRLTEWLALNPI